MRHIFLIYHYMKSLSGGIYIITSQNVIPEILLLFVHFEHFCELTVDPQFVSLCMLNRFSL